MKKILILGLLILSSGYVIAEDGKFEPVKLEVNGLDFDLKKQEEYQINKDVFEFKKWYVEPIKTNKSFDKPTITIE